MNEQINSVKKQLSFLDSNLLDDLLGNSIIKNFSKGTEILREEQYVKVLPIVLKGLVKVFSSFEERELLLYYIEPSQSCVMSFSAALSNKSSRVFAITEEDSTILLLPVSQLSGWLRKYPDLNELFYQQYDLRYSDLIETIEHLLLDKMDKRILDYLKHKLDLTNQKTIKISHGQIANELGTAREVVSRVIKKLEIKGKVSQGKNGIEII